MAECVPDGRGALWHFLNDPPQENPWVLGLYIVLMITGIAWFVVTMFHIFRTGRRPGRHR